MKRLYNILILCVLMTVFASCGRKGESSLKNIANKLGCSVSYLSHRIPEEFGMPLKKYIRQQRIEKAKKLLLDNLSVAECAYLLGYKDQFYFSKDFKKSCGISPMYWKKNKNEV